MLWSAVESIDAKIGCTPQTLLTWVRQQTELAEEVCLYAERFEGGGVTAEAVCSNRELISALAETWDGSVVRAKAHAGVIRSLRMLR